jgi:hypothetical protein
MWQGRFYDDQPEEPDQVNPVSLATRLRNLWTAQAERGQGGVMNYDGKNTDAQASVIQSIVKVTPGWWVTPPRDAYDIVAEYEAKRGA